MKKCWSEGNATEVVGMVIRSDFHGKCKCVDRIGRQHPELQNESPVRHPHIHTPNPTTDVDRGSSQTLWPPLVQSINIRALTATRNGKLPRVKWDYWEGGIMENDDDEEEEEEEEDDQKWGMAKALKHLASTSTPAINMLTLAALQRKSASCAS